VPAAPVVPVPAAPVTPVPAAPEVPAAPVPGVSEPVEQPAVAVAKAIVTAKSEEVNVNVLRSLFRIFAPS
jgi:hypothetical protein